MTGRTRIRFQRRHRLENWIKSVEEISKFFTVPSAAHALTIRFPGMGVTAIHGQAFGRPDSGPKTSFWDVNGKRLGQETLA